VIMQRLAQWEQLLAAHFDRARAETFRWGTFDCALAVCDGIKAITGFDPGANYRGKYSSEPEARALIGSDLSSFAAQVCAIAGFPEWLKNAIASPAFARRGDVVLIEVRDPAGALGTIDLSGRFAWCASERGFIRVPMRFWKRAWKIG